MSTSALAGLVVLLVLVAGIALGIVLVNYLFSSLRARNCPSQPAERGTRGTAQD